MKITYMVAQSQEDGWIGRKGSWMDIGEMMREDGHREKTIPSCTHRRGEEEANFI